GGEREVEPVERDELPGARSGEQALARYRGEGLDHREIARHRGAQPQILGKPAAYRCDVVHVSISFWPWRSNAAGPAVRGRRQINSAGLSARGGGGRILPGRQFGEPHG